MNLYAYIVYRFYTVTKHIQDDNRYNAAFSGISGAVFLLGIIQFLLAFSIMMLGQTYEGMFTNLRDIHVFYFFFILNSLLYLCNTSKIENAIYQFEKNVKGSDLESQAINVKWFIACSILIFFSAFYIRTVHDGELYKQQHFESIAANKSTRNFGIKDSDTTSQITLALEKMYKEKLLRDSLLKDSILKNSKLKIQN